MFRILEIRVKSLNEYGVSAEIAKMKPIRDIIYDYLRHAILNGEIVAGERIVERDFAEKFGASRTPLREAIRKLEMEGLLEYIPRKGAIVKGLDLTQIIEIYSIRQVLEVLAFKAAMLQLSTAEYKKLTSILDKLDLVDKKGDIEVVIKGLEEFDEIILNASKMPQLKEFIRTLQESIRRFRKLNVSDEMRRTEAISEHRAILQAMMNEDIHLMEQLVSQHVEHARQQLLKLVTKKNDKPLA